MNTIKRVPSIFLIICLVGFPQISETIYTPSLPDLAKSLGIQVSLAELTLSIYFIGFALGVFAYGILADAIGRKKALLLGIAVYILGSLGCGFSSSIGMLLFFRFVQAFGASAGSVVTQTILRDLYTGKERSKIFAVVSGALGFSPAIGPLLGGAIDELLHWRWNFYALVVMGVMLLGVCTLRLVETKLPSQNQSKKSCKDIVKLMKCMLSDPRVLCYAMIIAICNGIMFSYYAEAPFIFIEVIKLSPGQYGILGLVVALSFFIASYLSIKCNTYFQSERTITFGGGVSCLGAGLLAIICSLARISPDQSITVWIAMLLSIACIFIGIAIMIPNCLSNALVGYEQYSGTAASLLGLFYYCFIAIFTALMSYLHDGTVLAMPLYFFVLSASTVVLGTLLQNVFVMPELAQIGHSNK